MDKQSKEILLQGKKRKRSGRFHSFRKVTALFLAAEDLL